MIFVIYVIVFLLVAFAIYMWSKKSGQAKLQALILDNSWIATYDQAKQTFPSEQKNIYDYISSRVVESNSNIKIKKSMTGQEYDSYVNRKFESLRLKERSLNFLNVDEDQIKDVEPICIQGYVLNEKATTGSYIRFIGEDDVFRSPIYHSAYIYTGDKQLYIYDCKYDILTDEKYEDVYEYFYSDISSFQKINYLINDYKTEKTGCLAKPTVVKKVGVIKGFSIIVPNDKFECTTTHQAGLDDSISAMEQKMRERKYN